MIIQWKKDWLEKKAASHNTKMVQLQINENLTKFFVFQRQIQLDSFIVPNDCQRKAPIQNHLIILVDVMNKCQT